MIKIQTSYNDEKKAVEMGESGYNVDIFHAIPPGVVKGKQKHRLSSQCWCGPKLESIDDTGEFWVHFLEN